VPYADFPEPWRKWLQVLILVIVGLIVLQVVIGGGWVLFGIVLGLIAVEVALARYARRQM
jgi:hypothetical protein